MRWLIVFLLAGCLAPPSIMGPCEPSAPALVMSATVNMPMPDPVTPTWYVAWPDGELWAAAVQVGDSRPGRWNESRITSHELPVEEACGVAAFHGVHPDGISGPWWKDAVGDAYAVDLTFTDVEFGRGDAAALRGLVDRLATLPPDATEPDCADGASLRYTGLVDGEARTVVSHCGGTARFREFHEAAIAWFTSAGVRQP